MSEPVPQSAAATPPGLPDEHEADSSCTTPAPPAPTGTRPRQFGRLFALATVIASLGVAFWYFAIRDAHPGDIRSRLQGDWQIVLLEGGDAPGAGGPPSLVRIEGDRWTYIAGGRETSAWKLSLNPEARQLDLTLLQSNGQPAVFTHGTGTGTAVRQLGVYEFSRNEFKVVLAPVQEGRPKSVEQTELPVLTLKRVVY